MTEASGESLPPIHDLFPISQQAATVAHDEIFIPFRAGDYSKFLDELDAMETERDNSLYQEMMRKAYVIAGGMGNQDQAMFYIHGAVVCRRALREEAQLRGGSLPSVQQDSIDVYISDDLDEEKYGGISEINLENDQQHEEFIRRKDQQVSRFFERENALAHYFPRNRVTSLRAPERLFMAGLLETYRIFVTHHELAMVNEKTR